MDDRTIVLEDSPFQSLENLNIPRCGTEDLIMNPYMEPMPLILYLGDFPLPCGLHE